jgi:hypothetical protein
MLSISTTAQYIPGPLGSVAVMFSCWVPRAVGFEQAAAEPLGVWVRVVVQ